MAILFREDAAKNIRVGDSPVQAVYVGLEKVWPVAYFQAVTGLAVSVSIPTAVASSMSGLAASVTGVAASLSLSDGVSAVSGVVVPDAEVFGLAGSVSVVAGMSTSAVGPVVALTVSAVSMSDPSAAAGSDLLWLVTGVADSLSTPAVVSAVSGVVVPAVAVTGTAASKSTPAVVSAVSGVVVPAVAVTGTAVSTSTPAVVTGVVTVTASVIATAASVSTPVAVSAGAATVTASVTGAAASVSSSTASNTAIAGVSAAVTAAAASLSEVEADAEFVEPPPPTITGWNSAAANTATIPAHNVGDLILVWAGSTGISQLKPATAPTAPAAGGTVPPFTTLSAVPSVPVFNNANFLSQGQRWSYAIATATNHTLGTWSGANLIAVAVVTDAAPQPIGTFKEIAPTNSSTGSPLLLPGITPKRDDDTSLVIRTVTAYANRALTFNVPPLHTASYATPTAVKSFWAVTKDVTFGVVEEPQTYTGGAARLSFKATSIEILSRKVPTGQGIVVDTLGNSVVPIPLTTLDMDLAVVGGGAGGGGGGGLGITSGFAGDGGVWGKGQYKIADLLGAAGLSLDDVDELFARVTIGGGGRAGVGGILGSGPTGDNVAGQGGRGDNSTLTVIAKLTGGTERALVTLTGKGGDINKGFLLAPLRGFAVTGGNSNSGRDVVLNGGRWQGGGQSESPTFTAGSGDGKIPGGGGAGGLGGLVAGETGFRGARGRAHLRLRTVTNKMFEMHEDGEDTDPEPQTDDV